jgi:hypothetical protein
MLVFQVSFALALATTAFGSSYRRLNRQDGPLRDPEERQTHGNTNKYIIETQQVSWLTLTLHVE